MKLVILDRDGVINQDSDQFIKNTTEWKPIPGSLEAIAKLNHAGYRVVVASNQSGIGRGLLDMGCAERDQRQDVPGLAQVGGRIDALFYCPHAAGELRLPQTEAGHVRRHRPAIQRRSRGRAQHRRFAARSAGGRHCRSATDAGADRQGRKTRIAGGMPDGTPCSRIWPGGTPHRRMSSWLRSCVRLMKSALQSP